MRIGTGHGGVPGAIYEFAPRRAPSPSTGTATSSACRPRSGSQDFTTANWHRLDANNPTDAFNGIANLNVTDSDAKAVGLLFVVNDVRSDVGASIHNATVGSASVALTATESAFLQAEATITAEASGGSFYGSGTVVAGSGQAVTNPVLSQANAFIDASAVTTTAGVALAAANTSRIDARVLSATTSGDTAAGATIAFNTIGWNSQNILFNALDALIGRPDTQYDYTTVDQPLKLERNDRVSFGGQIYRWTATSWPEPRPSASPTPSSTTRRRRAGRR